MELGAGESKKVSYSLTPRELGFYGRGLKFGWEPGGFDVWVGGSSAAELHGEFTVPGEKGFKELAAGRPGVAKASVLGSSGAGAGVLPPPPAAEGRRVPLPPSGGSAGDTGGADDATGPTGK